MALSLQPAPPSSRRQLWHLRSVSPVQTGRAPRCDHRAARRWTLWRAAGTCSSLPHPHPAVWLPHTRLSPKSSETVVPVSKKAGPRRGVGVATPDPSPAGQRGALTRKSRRVQPGGTSGWMVTVKRAGHLEKDKGQAVKPGATGLGPAGWWGWRLLAGQSTGLHRQPHILQGRPTGPGPRAWLGEPGSTPPGMACVDKLTPQLL